jgi:hypothetical protein
VKFLILGIDFLRHHKLLVDVVGAQLSPRQPSAAAAAGTESPAAVCSSVSPPAEGTWSVILEEFPGIVKQFSVGGEPQHGVEHHIVTSGLPATAKFRRLDPTRLAAAKTEFKQMLAAGVIRRSDSGWASPLHMVRKKVGGWRPCGDFRRLNVKTADDK